MAQRETLIDRFVKYTKTDTQAAFNKDCTPSTPGQAELAKMVVEDLKKAGVDEIEMNDESYIYATIKGNLPGSHPTKGKVPTIGFLAHLDTANDCPGKNVKAQFIKNYNGDVISFPANPELKLTTEIDPRLKDCIGHTIITADGTTLLGCDDKAGISVLVEMVHYYKEHPEELHGDIRLAIIPDEEIGVGTEKLDLKKFGVDVAYTIDGGPAGEIDVESFNGFKGTITVEGNLAFPGYGKGIYVNAIQVLSKFIAAMDEERWPQSAEDRQPIWWVQEFKGDVGEASTMIFLRDFDLNGIQTQIKLLEGIKEKLLRQYPRAKITVDIKETYKNYKYELEKDPRVVGYAEEAMKRIGIAPKRNFVRGGNDACHLCFNGLLATNIFIGMHNMHSVLEWTSVETIEASLKSAVSLAKVWLDHAQDKRS